MKFEDNEVTRIIRAIEAGNRQASDELLPLVYEELRRLAQHRLGNQLPGQTLQATDLVHEAYVRLVDKDGKDWDSRGHFFSAAAEAMRRIVVERHRRKARQKHGGNFQRVDMHESQIICGMPSDDLLALDEALDQLEIEYPDRAQLIKLRYFAGLTLEQAAKSLGISRATACRHLTFARTWLYNQLRKMNLDDSANDEQQDACGPDQG